MSDPKYWQDQVYDTMIGFAIHVKLRFDRSTAVAAQFVPGQVMSRQDGRNFVVNSAMDALIGSVVELAVIGAGKVTEQLEEAIISGVRQKFARFREMALKGDEDSAKGQIPKSEVTGV